MNRGRDVLRWAVITAFGGVGAWVLFAGTEPILEKSELGAWRLLFFLFFLVPSVPLLLISYFMHSREYRKARDIFAVLGALLVAALLQPIPRYLGVHDFSQNINHFTKPLWVLPVLLPFIIVCLTMPYWAAVWFYRLFRRWTERFLPPAPAMLAQVELARVKWD
jgi:L-lactate permease